MNLSKALNDDHIEHFSIDEIDDAYWQSYGLSYDPFTTKTEGMYFSLPQWEREFELLQHLVQLSHKLLVLTGPQGCGKSAFLKQFSHRVRQEFQIHWLLGHPSFEESQLIEAATQAFNLPPIPFVDDNDTLENQFVKQLRHLPATEPPCLLIIDDAHRLSSTTLVFLLNLIKLQSHKPSHLHILLAGTSDLTQALLNLSAYHSAGKELTHMTRLLPLTLEETEQYLEFSLNIAGYMELSPFSEDDIQTIFQQSDGYIGNINIAAKRLLAAKASSNNKTDVDTKPFNKYRATLFAISSGLTAVFFAIAGLWIWHNMTASKTNETTQQEIAIAPLISKEPIENPPLQLEEPSSLLATPDEKQSPKTDDQLELGTEPEITLQPETAPLTSLDEDAPVPVAELEEAKPTASTLENDETLSSPAIAEPVSSDNTEISNVVTTNEINSETNNSVPTTNTVETAPSSKPAVTPTAKTDTNIDSSNTTVKTISSKKPVASATTGQYGIQLLGTRDLNTLKAFVKKHKIGTKISYYRTKHQGKDWYVLMYGKYSSVTQARQTIQQLPPSLKKLSPWLRSYAGLEKPMNLAQNKN